MPDDFPRDDLESLLDQSERQRVFDRRVDIESWAGGLSQEQKARVPVIRIGRRWINSLWACAYICARSAQGYGTFVEYSQASHSGRSETSA
jgi:hypothetical protein